MKETGSNGNGTWLKLLITLLLGMLGGGGGVTLVRPADSNVITSLNEIKADLKEIKGQWLQHTEKIACLEMEVKALSKRVDKIEERRQ